MKIFPSILFLCSFLFLFSCDKQSDSTASNLPAEEQTPEVFLAPENASDLLASASRKKYGRNIIDKLFMEAMEKDATLKDLNAEIEKIIENKSELWEPYNTYTDNNTNYWNSSDLYLNNISDSLKKSEIKQIFLKFKNQYQTRIQPFENTADAIAARSILLNNELTILKLMVSAQLMENYQKNELPDLAPLENLVEEYDELIKKTQQKIEQFK